MNSEPRTGKTKQIIISVIAAIALIISSVSVTSAVQSRKFAELEAGYSAELENARLVFPELITSIDFKDEPVYVIGHITPDLDTVASAMGMAYLLNALGINAEAVITEDINLETEYVFSKFDYTVPEILEDASGKQLWLTDHSAESQMVNGYEDTRIVGIVDHHGIGGVQNSEGIFVLSLPVGSTCSAVTMLCDACGVEMTREMAGILLVGILSDTANMKSGTVKQLDWLAFEKLKTISGITDTDGMFAEMLEAKLSYKNLGDTEIFYSDYKNYECNGYIYGIGCIKVARADLIPAMAERMQKVIQSEMENGCDVEFLFYNIYDVDYSTGYLGCCGKSTEFALDLMENTFGGTATKDGDNYVCTPSLNRKTVVVPAIDEYLASLPG